MHIDSIKNGIVIDHIPEGKSMELYDYLNLGELDCSVAILKNVPSKKMVRKDIIKIDSVIDVNLDILGYIVPNATVDIIRDGKLISKRHVELPERLVDIIVCKNPRCVTTSEQGIPHVFNLTDRENRVYRCAYCEQSAK